MGTTFGGPVAATSSLGISGSVQTPTLKFPGNNTNDNLGIQNNMGSEVMRFYNDDSCRFNGNATILGNASVWVSYIQQDLSGPFKAPAHTLILQLLTNKSMVVDHYILTTFSSSTNGHRSNMVWSR